MNHLEDFKPMNHLEPMNHLDHPEDSDTYRADPNISENPKTIDSAEEAVNVAESRQLAPPPLTTSSLGDSVKVAPPVAVASGGGSKRISLPHSSAPAPPRSLATKQVAKKPTPGIWAHVGGNLWRTFDTNFAIEESHKQHLRHGWTCNGCHRVRPLIRPLEPLYVQPFPATLDVAKC